MRESNKNLVFTDTWRKVKLGDIVNILDTKRKPISKSDRVAGEYPYYGANGVQDYVDGYIFDGDYILVGEDGSVITENKTPVVNLASGKFWANNHVHIIDNKKDIVDFKFLYYIIQTSNIAGYVHGNIPKLSQGNLKDIEVYLPSLPEQLQISSILSDYDMLIESERVKAFLEKQRHSSCRRYSIEYKKVKLGDICKIRSGGTPSSKVAEYYNGSIPFLSINDMTSQGKHVTETAKHITEDAIKSCSTWKAPAGSIVYSMCASVGFVSMVDVDFCMNQAIAVLTNLNKDVDKEYLYYILATLQGSDQLESVITTGAQRNINATILKNMIVNIPPLEHQLLISSLLSSYDSLIATVQSEQDSLMKIKSQLMTDIFS